MFSALAPGNGLRMWDCCPSCILPWKPPLPKWKPLGRSPCLFHHPIISLVSLNISSLKYLQLLWGYLTLPWAVLNSGIISAAISSSCPSCPSPQAGLVWPAKHRCCYGQQMLDSLLSSPYHRLMLFIFFYLKHNSSHLLMSVVLRCLLGIW